MLLNLDLFRSQPQQGEAGGENANSSDSMLDQLRTLNALGFFGNDSNYMNHTAGDGSEENPPPPAPLPSQEAPE
jgi:hypothetical protein